ncbi:MAG: hypothetical protein H0V04_02015 [Chloroflexi bacterium]|nr:hypothetical protein [Chloroflexota bacterium]
MDDLRSTLYPGERVLASKNANAVVMLREHGLAAIPDTARAMAWAGFAGKEAIGGRLHLTNWRLVFRSHPFNRVKGQMSILLPTIVEVADASRFLSKKLRVTSRSTEHEFVVWGVPALIRAIAQARADADGAAIQAAVQADPSLLGSGLAKDLRVYLMMTRGLGPLLDIVSNPLDIANVLNVIELIESYADIDDARPPEVVSTDAASRGVAERHADVAADRP